MTELRLRPYQREAIDAVFKAWSEGMRRPAIVLPTGAGKTVVFSALVKEFQQHHDVLRAGYRVMVLAHRDELVDQAIAKLRATMPGVSVGKVKADDNDIYADVMVCSVQTAQRKRLEALASAQDNAGQIGLIITDECHHAAAVSYGKVYDAFPDALQLGVTATLERGDGVGLGSVWDDVVYKRSILWMISKGYLTDVRTRRVDLAALDMGAVKVSRGDYAAGDLGTALMDAEADTAIARAYKEHAGDRQGIVFTPTVETAVAATVALNRAGIKALTISGETTREARQERYEEYRTGALQVLVNCMVLTEGFDMPQVSAIVVARPTRSRSLYAQMVGRGLRPWPDKTDCLVLDLVGASANRLSTLIDLEPGAVKELREGESLAEAVVREEEDGNRKIKAGSLAFELRARDVDSFGASEHAWARTAKGVMFINCGDTHVFLWPSDQANPGTWDVCLYRRGQQWHRTEYTGLSIGEAMAWGEAVAEDFSSFGVTKSAAWRKRKPSEKQVNFARALGIEVTEGMCQGQLGDLIDQRQGSRIFDPYVRG